MQVERLEKLLQVIEDVTWVIRTEMQHSGFSGYTMPDSTRLRVALQSRDEDEVMSVLREYVVDPGFDPHNESRGMLMRLLSLVDWVFESQRVYRVSPALAQMLLDTELPTFTPESVRWVAPAFAVLLEEPVVSASGFAHDCMVMSQAARMADLRPEFADQHASILSIQSYGSGFDAYERISTRDRTLFERSCRQRHQRVYKMHEKFKRRADQCDTRGFIMNARNNLPYNRVVEQQHGDTPDWTLIFQLCMGLNLYLQSARSSDREVQSTVTVHGTERGPGLGNGAVLFDLSVGEALRPRHVGYTVRDGSRTIRPHFRKGFWRRPRGYGNDPDAPQTEWVRPTWVHKERIAQGEQPIGSVHTVKPVG